MNLKIVRRVGRIILIPIIGLLTLLLTLMIAIQIPAVQTKAVAIAVDKLNESLGTDMSADRVAIDFFGDINLFGVKAKDEKGLEFINIPQLKARLSLTEIIKNPNSISVKKLKLFQPIVKVVTYKGEETSNFIDFIDKFSGDNPDKKSDFRLRGIVQVVDGELLIQNQNLEGNKQNWIDAKKFNLDVENFRLINDEIWADMKHLSFEGKRNGENYVLKEMATNFHLSDQEMRFDQLKIITEDSDLQGHLVFSYDRQEDMKDFENKVQWDVVFNEGSKVGLKDIRYFVDDFDKDHIVDIQGTAQGTLNNMVFTELQLNGEGVFVAADRLHLIDMLEGDQIIIDSKQLKAKTSYREFTSLMPNFISDKIPDYLQRFGQMDYKGDFNLDPDEININGYAITALGDADLKVKLNDYKGDLRYEGTLIADHINLHQITEVKELGMVAGRMDFKGRGTDIKNLKIESEGSLAYLDLMGKRYHNVLVDGRLEKEKFTGYLSIKDPQLYADYDGIFDFSRKPYQLNFRSKIDHLDLDYLGITQNKNAKIKAIVDGDLSFSNLDDFLGAVELDNVYFTSKTDTVAFSHAHLISSEKSGNKNLEVDIPGYMRGEVHGQYKLSQLPDALLNTVGERALLTYKPQKVDPNQKFNFYFEFGQDLLNLFDSRFEIAPGTIADGIVDTSTNTMIAELSSTSIGYDGFVSYNPLVNIDTSKTEEQIYVRSDSLQIKNNMIYDVSIYTTPIREDYLLYKTKFSYGKKYKVDFDLNLVQSVNENKNLVLGFYSSSILIDDNKWMLNPENDPTTNHAIINFDKNYYEINNIRLESEDQKLIVNGYYKSDIDYKLKADISNLDLNKIIPKGALGELKVDGIANGDVDIIRTKAEFKPLAQLKITDVALNDYDLGDLHLNGSYNATQNVFDVELFLEQQQVQVLYANGYIDNKPKVPEINMVASLDDVNFKFVESFLSAALSNLRGMVSGNMRFTGPIDSPEFEGMLDLANLGFKVDYLNVDYSFDGTHTVPVYKQSGGQGSISLDDVPFRDTKYGTTGEVTGQILFRDFATWFLNLSFNTDNLLVLNTNQNLNDLFYGKVFGQGSFSLFGPPDRLDISAKAIVNEGSEFTINTGATKVEGNNQLVRFIPEEEKSDKNEGPKGFNIDIEIEAHPNSTVNLVFDPMTNDKVIAHGYTEKLKFNMSRTGAISLDGIYTLDNGRYEFRQVPLVSRDFTIKKGSYVSWSGGSPFDAVMNITANYEKTVSNVSEFLGTGYNQAYDVILGIVISESLANPKMDFVMSIPRGGADVQSMLDYKFNLAPDDKMIQFGAILLLGQFMTDSDAVLAKGTAQTGAGIALKQLGGIINAMIAGEGISFDMDYVSGSAMSGTSDMFKGNININLSPRWTFNGMVGVPVGGGYVNETTTGEAEIAWDISRQMDKTLVVNFFTRPTNFGVQNFGGAGNFQSFGAGITYRTSFDRIAEIFESKEKEKKSDKKDKKILGIFKTKKSEEETELPKEVNPESDDEKQSVPTETQPSGSAEEAEKEVSKLDSNQKKKSANPLIRFR